MDAENKATLKKKKEKQGGGADQLALPEWMKQYVLRILEGASCLLLSFLQRPQSQNQDLQKKQLKNKKIKKKEKESTILYMHVLMKFDPKTSSWRYKYNTRRVPSESIFEPLAIHFYVQPNRY